MLLGHHYKTRLPVALRDSNLTTIDITQTLRSCGTEVFLKAMQNHRNTLLQTLKESSSNLIFYKVMH